MPLKKMDGKGISILKLTVIYAVFTAVAVFIAVFLINSSIYIYNTSPTERDNISQGTVVKSSVQGYDVRSADNTDRNLEKTILTGIPSDVSFLSFSGDGQYCIYCSKGALFISDIQTGKLIKQVSGMGAIEYALLMYDRNIVIYFTAGHSRSTAVKGPRSEITVNTYNIDTGMQTTQYSMKAGSGAEIRWADYSSMTGHVAFDLYSGKSDAIYYINLMKHLAKVPTGGNVENAALANNSQIIYYEKGNILYCQSRPVKCLNSIRTKLLGCDLNDYLYVQSQSDKKLIYVAKGVSVVRRIKLDDPNFINVYSNKTNIYLVYPDHVLDLSASPDRKTAYDRGYNFKGLINGCLYLTDNKGNIVRGTAINK